MCLQKQNLFHTENTIYYHNNGNKKNHIEPTNEIEQHADR